MKFSMIIVSKYEKGGGVSGWWVQNHIGDLESAKKWMDSTNTANGNKLDLAVIDQVPSGGPPLSLIYNKKKLL